MTTWYNRNVESRKGKMTIVHPPETDARWHASLSFSSCLFLSPLVFLRSTGVLEKMALPVSSLAVYPFIGV